MKNTMSRRIAIFARGTLFTLACAAFAAGATYSQGTGGLGGNPGGKPATNADILNMLSAGLSEETILTTMRTRPAKFDVSNQARAKFDKECAEIKHVGVTTALWAAEVKNIWDAMMDVVLCQETNGRGGDGCAPSGQQTESKPSTNGGRSGQPDAAGHKRGDYSALVPAIQRPAVNDGNVAAAGGINNGNQNADELSPQPYPPKGMPSAGQSQAADQHRRQPAQDLMTKEQVVQMVHQGVSETAIIAAIRANPARFGLSLQRMQDLQRQGVSTHILNAMMISELRAMRTSPALIRPGQTMSATGAGSPIAGAPAPAVVPAASGSRSIVSARNVASPAPAECAKDATLRILGVYDGSAAVKTFKIGHSYTIVGCSFATQLPSSFVYMFGGNDWFSFFLLFFQVQSWNDNFIVFSTDPSENADLTQYMNDTHESYIGPLPLTVVIKQGQGAGLDGCGISIN